MNLFFKCTLSNCYGKEKKFLNYICSNAYYNLFIPKLQNFQGSTRLLSKKFKVGNLKCLQENQLKPNSVLYLQVLGSGAYGAPKSVFVYTPNHSFLFNCGEGMRRIANEGKRGISNVNSVFITSNAYENISGIPGLQEHVYKSRRSSFKTYGPEGLGLMMDAFSTLDVDFVSCVEYKNILNESLNFNDCIHIHAVPIYQSVNQQGKTEGCHETGYSKGYVITYICEASPYPGVVCTDKLVDFGIPPGPLVHQLKSGTSVTLPNGRIVSPRQVVKDSHERTFFFVVDIPSVNYLDSLVLSRCFDKFKNHSNNSFPELIIHFTPSNVMRDSRYLEWVESFPCSSMTSHLVINDQNECLGLRDSLAAQIKLNRLNSSIFPLLHHCGLPPLLSSRKEDPNSEKMPSIHSWTEEYKFSGSTIQANSLLMYHFRPHKQFDSSRCGAIVQQQLLNSCFEDEMVSAAMKTMQEKTCKLTNLDHSRYSGEMFPLITFLGTGSACPSPIRNVSGILLNLNKESTMILDCGEGTFNQMVRLFGREKSMINLLKLKLVYISHYHRDHHLGLVTLLIQRQEAYREVNSELPILFVLATTPVCMFLKNVHKTCYPILKNVRLLNNVNLLKNGKVFLPELLSDVCSLTGLTDLLLTYVPHCRNSFGVSFVHKDGWKITYSGDTMPSEDLVRIGMGSDLLIHEASFESGMEKDAWQKRHSTVDQAINAGNAMKAKFTLLTHFSQRYYMIPILECYPDNVGIAFDYMSVTLSDLPLLPHFYPVFKEIFYDSWEKITTKTYRRLNIDC